MKLKTIAKGFMIFLAIIFVCIVGIIVFPYIEKTYEKLNYKIRGYQYIYETKAEHKRMNWQPLHDNLYQANNGELALKTLAMASNDQTVDRYITHFGLCIEDEGNTPLKDVIDIDSFRQLSYAFYRDNNYIYQHYGMSDGGMFYIFQIEDDIDNFIILNEFYAKDSNYIYHHRGSVDTSIFDYDTFKTCANCHSFTKDKNGYYIFEHKIDIDEMINDPDTSSKDIANLKKLKSL